MGEQVRMIRAVRIVRTEGMPDYGSDPVDVVIRDGVVVDIAPVGALPSPGPIIEGDGGWLIPGLWDHHVHTVQWALHGSREQLGECASAAEAASRMAGAAPASDGRRVGAGSRNGLWPDAPSLALLDAYTGDVPTYLISADVHSAWLNSAALRREQMLARAVEGVLVEDDAFEISRRLNTVDAATADTAVAQAGLRAAARGVTGIVDFDLAWNAEVWPRRVAGGFSAHRVEAATYPSELDRAIGEGLRTGEELAGTNGLVRVGALKIITDGSLGTRTAACSHPYSEWPRDFGALNVDTPALIDLMTRATAAGLEVAAHAIGDRAVTTVLDAFALTGACGALEHAQLVRHADLGRFARLGVAASVQPQHALDDRDLVARHWGEQTAVLYPLASLRDAGARLQLGSDAPVAPLDPWGSIAAAVFRHDPASVLWQQQERLTAAQALRASTRHGGDEVRIGGAADLVVCGADPLAADAETLRAMPIVATMLGGRITHLA